MRTILDVSVVFAARLSNATRQVMWSEGSRLTAVPVSLKETDRHNQCQNYDCHVGEHQRLLDPP